jgi:hypothetical protein
MGFYWILAVGAFETVSQELSGHTRVILASGSRARELVRRASSQGLLTDPPKIGANL